jgi:type IV secretory pathway VirB2 component (pilin)
MKKTIKRVRKHACFGLILSTISFSAQADVGNDMLSSVLMSLINLLTSTPTRLIFVLSIIGIGYGTLALGRIPKEKAIAAILGIGIVFSASYITQKLGLSH